MPFDLISQLAIELPDELRGDEGFRKDLQIFFCAFGLKENEQHVLLARLGHVPGAQTTSEIADSIGRCVARVHQIELFAIRKLRHSFHVLKLTPQLIESELEARNKPGPHNTSWGHQRRYKRFRSIIEKIPTQQLPVEWMQISSRTRRALIQSGANTIGEVAAMGEAEVKGLYGIGEKGLEQVKEALAARNLSFCTNTSPDTK